MELNSKISRGASSISVEASQVYGGPNHVATIVLAGSEGVARMALDQAERDALVAALQSVPRNEV